MPTVSLSFCRFIYATKVRSSSEASSSLWGLASHLQLLGDSHRGSLGGPQPAVVRSSTSTAPPFWSSFSSLGAGLPTQRFCAMLIFTNQSWVFVVALDSRLISSVHGDHSKSSRYCHGPRLVVSSPPRVPSGLSSAWFPRFLFGHFLLVCPCSWQEKHRPSSKHCCFSSCERYCSLLVWFFFGHFLLICPRPWQQKHKPPSRCRCLSFPVRCHAHPVVVLVAISVR